MTGSEIVNEFAAGAFGGLVGLVVGHPCDTMKTVTQNSRPGQKMGVTQLGRRMTQLGAQTFFRGLSVPLWSYAVVNSVFFGAQKTFEKALGANPSASGPHEQSWFALSAANYAILAATGAASGAVQLLPSVPVEVIKVRMQKNAHKEGPRPRVGDTVRRIWAEGGVRGFYRGGSAQFLRDVPASASYFLCYEAARRLLRRRTEWSEGPVALLSGALAGWVSWVIPIPQDVIKTRLQAGREPDFRSCVRAMRAEGPQAFVAGLGLVSVRAFLVNGVTFWGYEQAIRRMHGPPAASDSGRHDPEVGQDGGAAPGPGQCEPEPGGAVTVAAASAPRR